MKKLKTIAIALLIVLGTTVSVAQNKKINIENSKITWLAKKTGGQHEGTINFTSGTLVFKKKALKGGSFVVDMNSINTTDLESGKGREDLNGHLKSPDFFGVEKFPTSKIEFKTISGKGKGLYTVTADLTIKDITEPVTFDITVTGKTATTSFKVDRTKYGIKYKSKSVFSDLGDKFIYDDFDLTIKLEF
ncbi:YceI family protein [Flavobacterium sp.]|uniref:YceI family protein n=1 Tax=Flavobacterium sp. TaxID=239 RepID=UPI00375194DA